MVKPLQLLGLKKMGYRRGNISRTGNLINFVTSKVLEMVKYPWTSTSVRSEIRIDYIARNHIYLLYRGHRKKSHGLIPTHPSQRHSRAATLHPAAYFPIFPSRNLAVLFTGMLVVILSLAFRLFLLAVLLSLHFVPEEGDITFLRNLGTSLKYAVLLPRVLIT
jgi:hypothetical protein